MGLPINISLKLKDVGEIESYFHVSPDLSPSMFNTSSWSKWVSVLLVGDVEKGTQVRGKGWVR